VVDAGPAIERRSVIWPRFELSHDRRNISDDDLLADMRRVAGGLDSPMLKQRDYGTLGRYAIQTVIRRFGSWNAAVERAGLTKTVERQISNEQLFENMLALWTTLGRQPLYPDVRAPQSTYHVATYERRFGSWRSALEAFVDWANEENKAAPGSASPAEPLRRRTPRSPDLRLRFKVLQRDRFTCCTCGTSPATRSGTVLQIDHVEPWSAGGETVLENLQTLCEACNQGKSNVIAEG
jgi:hypothetical protein